MKKYLGEPFAMETDLLIAWSVAFAVAGLVVIVLNALALFSFMKNKSLQTRKHFMIINLTVAEVLFGAIGMWSTVFYLLNPSGVSFHLFFISNMFTKIACLLTLGLIAIERMHAIVWPLRHQVLGSSVYKTALVLSWVLSAAITITLSLRSYNAILEVALPVAIAVVIIAMTTSYISIWVSAHRRKKDKRNTATNRDKALIVTLLLVAGAFVVTWVFPALYMSISDICSCHEPSFSVTLSIYLVSALESVINPVIYCFRIPGFQIKIKAKMVKIKCLERSLEHATVKSTTRSPPSNEVEGFVTVL